MRGQTERAEQATNPAIKRKFHLPP